MALPHGPRGVKMKNFPPSPRRNILINFFAEKSRSRKIAKSPKKPSPPYLLETFRAPWETKEKELYTSFSPSRSLWPPFWRLYGLNGDFTFRALGALGDPRGGTQGSQGGTQGSRVGGPGIPWVGTVGSQAGYLWDLRVDPLDTWALWDHWPLGPGPMGPMGSCGFGPDERTPPSVR